MASSSTSKAALAPSDGSQLTYNETVEVICGFIKTAIHTILCHRQVYPPNVFTRRQRYRVPVWASRHPGLTSYIDEVIDAAKVQIEKDALRSIHVVLTSISSGQILERYRFDLLTLLSNIQPRDRNLSVPGNMTMETIELHLRAFMMKLISLDGALSDIEVADDITWAVVLDMKDGLEPQTDDRNGNEPSQGPWVPFDEVQPKQVTSSDESPRSTEGAIKAISPRPREREGKEQDGPLVLPVKSLDTGVVNLMLYVEEHPLAKRASQQAKGALKARRIHLQDDPVDASIRIGERDIDTPLPQPSSSGAVANRREKSKKKKTTVQEDDGDDSSAGSLSERSDSGDSIRSVNDFAGYGKGAGSVGMSGVGM